MADPGAAGPAPAAGPGTDPAAAAVATRREEKEKEKEEEEEAWVEVDGAAEAEQEKQELDRRRGHGMDLIVAEGAGTPDGEAPRLCATRLLVRFHYGSWLSRAGRFVKSAVGKFGRGSDAGLAPAGVERAQKQMEAVREGRKSLEDVDESLVPVAVKVGGEPRETGTPLFMHRASGWCLFDDGGLTPPPAFLAALQLQRGANHVSLTACDEERGTEYVVDITAFLWSADARIVVCDFDGTVTRSNVRGLIENFSQDETEYTHRGITTLLRAAAYPQAAAPGAGGIPDEEAPGSSEGGGGLHVLYLTSRPIVLVNATRRLLRDVRQEDVTGVPRRSRRAPSLIFSGLPSADDVKRWDAEEASWVGLPEGPVLCSPDSTAGVLYTELFARAADKFKVGCLEIVLETFRLARKMPGDDDGEAVGASEAAAGLFVAGIGNTHTDVLAYRHVGVPEDAIIVVNKSSVVTRTRKILSPTGTPALRPAVSCPKSPKSPRSRSPLASLMRKRPASALSAAITATEASAQADERATPPEATRTSSISGDAAPPISVDGIELSVKACAESDPELELVESAIEYESFADPKLMEWVRALAQAS